MKILSREAIVCSACVICAHQRRRWWDWASFHLCQTKQSIIWPSYKKLFIKSSLRMRKISSTIERGKKSPTPKCSFLLSKGIAVVIPSYMLTRAKIFGNHNNYVDTIWRPTYKDLKWTWFFSDFGSFRSQCRTVLLNANSWAEPMCVELACVFWKDSVCSKELPVWIRSWEQGETTQKLNNLYLGPISVCGDSWF